MTNSIQFGRIALSVLFLTYGSCSTNSAPALLQSVDPSGCVLDHVAVEVGTNQYQYDSFSPDGSIIANWTASTDNVGVDHYRVLRNLVEVLVVPGTETTATVLGLGNGDHYIQIQAVDAAGNMSFRTSPVLVTI